MAIHDLYIEGIYVESNKTDTILAVDADALAFTIPRQRFKMIAARNCQAGKAGGPVQDGELLQRHSPDAGWNAAPLARLPE